MDFSEIREQLISTFHIYEVFAGVNLTPCETKDADFKNAAATNILQHQHESFVKRV